MLKYLIKNKIYKIISLEGGQRASADFQQATGWLKIIYLKIKILWKCL